MKETMSLSWAAAKVRNRTACNATKSHCYILLSFLQHTSFNRSIQDNTQDIPSSTPKRLNTTDQHPPPHH